MKPSWLLQRAALTAELVCNNPTTLHSSAPQLSGLAALASLRPAPIACTDQHNPHWQYSGPEQPAASGLREPSNALLGGNMLAGARSAAAQAGPSASCSRGAACAAPACKAPVAHAIASASPAATASASHGVSITLRSHCQRGAAQASGALGALGAAAAAAGGSGRRRGAVLPCGLAAASASSSGSAASR